MMRSSSSNTSSRSFSDSGFMGILHNHHLIMLGGALAIALSAQVAHTKEAAGAALRRRSLSAEDTTRDVEERLQGAGGRGAVPSDPLDGSRPWDDRDSALGYHVGSGATGVFDAQTDLASERPAVRVDRLPVFDLRPDIPQAALTAGELLDEPLLDQLNEIVHREALIREPMCLYLTAEDYTLTVSLVFQSGSTLVLYDGPAPLQTTRLTTTSIPRFEPTSGAHWDTLRHTIAAPTDTFWRGRILETIDHWMADHQGHPGVDLTLAAPGVLTPDERLREFLDVVTDPDRVRQVPESPVDGGGRREAFEETRMELLRMLAAMCHVTFDHITETRLLEHAVASDLAAARQGVVDMVLGQLRRQRGAAVPVSATMNAPSRTAIADMPSRPLWGAYVLEEPHQVAAPLATNPAAASLPEELVSELATFMDDRTRRWNVRVHWTSLQQDPGLLIAWLHALEQVRRQRVLHTLEDAARASAAQLILDIGPTIIVDEAKQQVRLVLWPVQDRPHDGAEIEAEMAVVVDRLPKRRRDSPGMTWRLVQTAEAQEIVLTGPQRHQAMTELLQSVPFSQRLQGGVASRVATILAEAQDRAPAGALDHFSRALVRTVLQQYPPRLQSDVAIGPRDVIEELQQRQPAAIAVILDDGASSVDALRMAVNALQAQHPATTPVTLTVTAPPAP